MSNITSILHISDLHRSRDAKITNNAILSSLINDCDSYTNNETPKIKHPDLIIVSGDIIRGSVQSATSDAEIKGQYQEAKELLTGLCNYYLNNDKSRIIIIPGNHDIDWKFSKESMVKMESNKVYDSGNLVKTQLLKDAINHQSNIRWSWRDLSFYEITDETKYNKRLEAFSNFYREFYDDQRTYSITPKEQFDIFDYPQYDITIVAFNSCYNNDHLRQVGDIHPDCIANANLKLREFKKEGRLILATWHHNTKGLPYDSTYMDASKLKNFINSGILLGFHGHQHKTELIHEYSDVIEQKNIIVFSAGTLCGGPNELPTGTSRQYNLIEISRDESDLIGVTLHTREKTESSSFDNPIWTTGRIDSHLVSNYSFSLKKPKGLSLEVVLLEIEKLVKQRRYIEAKKRLIKLPWTDEFVRRFLFTCIVETDDSELAYDIFLPPQNDGECLIILNYAIQSGSKTRRIECLTASKKYNSKNAPIKNLETKLEALLK